VVSRDGTLKHDLSGTGLALQDSNGDGNNNRNTYAFLTSLQNAKGQTTFTQNYDYSSGQPYYGSDATLNYSLNSYGGPALATDRLVQTIRGYNTNNATQTNYSYAATTDRLTYQDQNAAGDRALAVEQLWDHFGPPTTLKARSTRCQLLKLLLNLPTGCTSSFRPYSRAAQRIRQSRPLAAPRIRSASHLPRTGPSPESPPADQSWSAQSEPSSRDNRSRSASRSMA